MLVAAEGAHRFHLLAHSAKRAIIARASRRTRAVIAPCAMSSASVTTPTGVEDENSVCDWRFLAPHPDHLGRAAADVEHQRAVVARTDQRRAAHRRKPRFLFLRHDRQRDAGLLARARDQASALLAPRRPPSRWRALGDAAMRGCVRRRLEARRACARLRPRQASRLRDALAETHDARERIRPPGTRPAVGPRDQEPAIVGSEIEHGERRGAGRAPVRLFPCLDNLTPAPKTQTRTPDRGRYRTSVQNYALYGTHLRRATPPARAPSSNSLRKPAFVRHDQNTAFPFCRNSRPKK